MSHRPLWANFEAALTSLETLSERDPGDEAIRDATIKRFEYTYEAAWKALQRALSFDLPYDPRNVPLPELFRLGEHAGYVRSARAWFTYRDARNQTSHVYNERDAERVFRHIPDFRDDAQYLLTRLRAAFPES